jgi:glycosyltransferase involved in cell wall biosynthesis
MKIGIVVPCYNEQAVLPETVSRLGALLARMAAQGQISADSGVWLVDDGSTDATWEGIRLAVRQDARFHGIRLSRNRGHQSALLAGLELAKGDAVITIDADLQDDVTVIEKMVDLCRGGSDIVYGVRRSRATDSRFKRMSAELYYSLLARMGVEVVFNHADYRLMSRRALDALHQYSEVNLFLRGIIPQLGFTTATVPYDRAERFAGESKYPLRKMLSLAVNGITSFSVMPLRLIAVMGFLVCLFSAGMVAWVLYGSMIMHDVIPGWASSVIPVYFLGGVQLLSIGVIGEYVGKIYLETKRRPRFLIQEEIGNG